MPDLAKEVIKSARGTTKNIIAMGRGIAPLALRTCDHVWRANANTLFCNPAPISQNLKDDLISIPGQVTLIASFFADRIANRAERVVDQVADIAHSTVNQCVPLLESRAIRALTPVAEPIAMVIYLAADRAAHLSRQLPGVTDLE